VPKSSSPDYGGRNQLTSCVSASICRRNVPPCKASTPLRNLLAFGMAQLTLTITMKSGARIGPGKAALLESVRSSGSISAAARAMGMDYKRAWLLVDSINRAFKNPAVERMAGGTGGGGAVLTPFGQDLLDRYRRIEAAARQLAVADLKALEKRATPDPGPKV
jgi:molybdate transport system regulatory protein